MNDAVVETILPNVNTGVTLDVCGCVVVDVPNMVCVAEVVGNPLNMGGAEAGVVEVVEAATWPNGPGKVDDGAAVTLVVFVGILNESANAGTEAEVVVVVVMLELLVVPDVVEDVGGWVPKKFGIDGA